MPLSPNDKRIRIDITVCGPGGCINNEVEIIENILKRYGHDVHVINDHPDDIQTPEEGFEKLYRNEHERKVDKEHWVVVVHARHEPWGG